jgi:hypothetical protein
MGQCESMELSSVAFLFGLGSGLWRLFSFRFGCCWPQGLGRGFGLWIIFPPPSGMRACCLLLLSFTR